ncbi:hypothetical protein EDC01DRAFT_777935 [Geopyxis carbonaria]|nr:hypothetical protein EDC01DRAFT_777935 [Geopyxis carbonaria]
MRPSQLLGRSQLLLHTPLSRTSLSRCPHHIRPLSTRKTPKYPPQENETENPSYPTFTLKGLGANRTVKVVVVAALTVMATAETVFWGRVVWGKWGPKGDGDGMEGSIR